MISKNLGMGWHRDQEWQTIRTLFCIKCKRPRKNEGEGQIEKIKNTSKEIREHFNSTLVSQREIC